MMAHKKHVAFQNHIYIIGFGSIGQGTLPLLLRHIDIKPKQITIITADTRGESIARENNVEFIVNPLTRENYQDVLKARLKAGDLMINVSVEVHSAALMELCQEIGVLYVDTVCEPWGDVYFNRNLTLEQRTNYMMREEILALRAKYPEGHTSISCHGANPGLVNHFVKQALLNIAKDTKKKIKKPVTREDWAKLAMQLGIKVIHIAERDTQVSKDPKKVGEFVNTWSIDGFVSEGNQPAELGWGTHEKSLPRGGKTHRTGSKAAIYIERPGALTRVRSWTPLEGPYHGFLITHDEAISIADYITLRKGDEVIYRPTCHYAYHPCDAAVLSLQEMNGKNGKVQSKQRLIMDDIASGMDELGVLLMGNEKGVYWFGSRLSIEQTRKSIPYNNATSLQVAVAVLAGAVWAIENPKCGIVEPENMDFERILEIATPYLGDVVGVWGEWTPLQDRCLLFSEIIDSSDPWQFKNILVQ